MLQQKPRSRPRDGTLSEDVGSGPFKGLLIHFWRRKWRMAKSFSNKEINQSNGLRFDNLKHQKLQSSFSISESYFEFCVCVRKPRQRSTKHLLASREASVTSGLQESVQYCMHCFTPVIRAWRIIRIIQKSNPVWIFVIVFLFFLDSPVEAFDESQLEISHHTRVSSNDTNRRIWHIKARDNSKHRLRTCIF